MTNRLLIILIIPFCLLSCGDTADPDYVDHDYEKDVEEVETSISAGESNDVTVVPVAPPVTEERMKIEEDAASESPFLQDGCCAELEKRVDDCCCDAVLAKYKEMKSKGDRKLGEYKMKDPILGKCRSKMAKAFDEIDNPPVENPEDDW